MWLLGWRLVLFSLVVYCLLNAFARATPRDLSPRNRHASLHAQRPMRAKHARLEPAREGIARRGSPELAQPTFPSKGEGTDAH